MNVNIILTENKCFSLDIFEKAWPCFIDSTFRLTTKNQEDHWGLYTYLVVLGYKIFDLQVYDIRHAHDSISDIVNEADMKPQYSNVTNVDKINLANVSIRDSGIWRSIVPTNKHPLYLFLEQVYCHPEEKMFCEYGDIESEQREEARLSVLQKRREFLQSWVDYNYNDNKETK